MDIRLLLLLVYISTSLGSKLDCSSRWKTAAPSDRSCAKYIMCRRGRVIERHCPKGKSFDIYRSMCIPSSVSICSSDLDHGIIKNRAHCKDLPPLPTTPKPNCDTVPFHDKTQVVVKSVCDRSGIVYVPDPNDCTQYAICLFGIPIRRTCPNRMKFSPTAQRCLPRQLGRCTQHNGNMPTVTCSDVPSFCNTWVNAIFPDPDDCRFYYVCSSGVPVHRMCPMGYCFSPTFLMCLYKDLADCKPFTRMSTTTSEPTSIVVPATPSLDGCGPSESWLKPVEDNCMEFRICDFGVVWHAHCSDGQFFDPELLICLPEYEVKCTINIFTTVSTTPAQVTTNTPVTSTTPVMNTAPVLTTTPAVTTKVTTATPEIVLPTMPPPDKCGPTQLWVKSVLENCEEYWICAFGQLTHSRCQQGYLFDKLNHTCRLKREVVCDLTITTTRPTKPSRVCRDGEQWLSPDVENCNYYYNCLHGVMRREKCDQHLHFSSTKLRCLPQEVADCETVSATPTHITTTYSTPTIKHPNTTKSYISKTTPVVTKSTNDSESTPTTKKYIALTVPTLNATNSGPNARKHNSVFIAPSRIVTKPTGDSATNPAATKPTPVSRTTPFMGETIPVSVVTDPIFTETDLVVPKLAQVIIGPDNAERLKVNCSYSPEKPIFNVPNPKNCSTYFTCHYGHIFTGRCPMNTEFSPRFKVCLPREEAECSIKHETGMRNEECPPGELARRPEPGRPAAYRSCTDGYSHPHLCPEGEIFDADTSICVKSTKVTEQKINEEKYIKASDEYAQVAKRIDNYGK